MKKTFLTLLLCLICVFSCFSNTETFKAAEKSLEVNIEKNYNSCTFKVGVQKRGDYEIKLLAPNGNEFYFEKEQTNELSYVCTVKNVKMGAWKVYVSEKNMKDVGKISVSVTSAKTEDGNIKDSISVGKDIAGLDMYLKNNVLVAKWTDDSCGAVSFVVTDLDTSAVIANEKSTTKTYECVCPDTVQNISVTVTPSRSNGISGASSTYVFNRLADAYGTVSYPDVSYTNQNTLSVSVNLTSPYGFYVEVNGREVLEEETHPAGTYEVEVPLIDDGENLIQFFLVDESNNMISTDYTVIRDDVAPILSLSQEYDGITTKDLEFVIDGTAQDFDEFTINGEDVEVATDGVFSHVCTLHTGENKITLLLKDKAGNETLYNILLNVPEKKNISPYMLLIIAGIILALVFFSKKNKKASESKNSPVNDVFSSAGNETVEGSVKNANMTESARQNDGLNQKLDQNIQENEKNSKSKQSFLELFSSLTSHKTVLKYVLFAALLFVFFQFIVSPGYITSGSMEPTVMTDDIVVYNRLAYVKNTPSYEDIIWFEHNGEKLCKRIIGIAGDEISFADGYVYRNGERIEETYIDEDIETNSMKTFIVPENKLFVLGDNREYSYDSRYWDNPYVDINDVKGKQLLIIPFHNIVK